MSSSSSCSTSCSTGYLLLSLGYIVEYSRNVWNYSDNSSVSFSYCLLWSFHPFIYSLSDLAICESNLFLVIDITVALASSKSLHVYNKNLFIKMIIIYTVTFLADVTVLSVSAVNNADMHKTEVQLVKHKRDIVILKRLSVNFLFTLAIQSFPLTMSLLASCDVLIININSLWLFQVICISAHAIFRVIRKTTHQGNFQCFVENRPNRKIAPLQADDK
ncbi:hypothetical protein Tsp_11279 [Trichinella spiralis]|uniref:hypothetical protein n=1 Tax=Trichinella spiralis TaxID=6334 RepID=UPI0001EFED29|nr:hypothetical protein Tsp_11279 [Trichinella spiralis]